MKTILVTGSNGLLGQKIIYALRNRSDVRCIATAIGENRLFAKDGYEYQSMDVTDKNQIEKTVQFYQRFVVLQCRVFV